MTGKKTHIAENLTQIRARIEHASAAAGRAPGTVRLLAMSKTFDVEAIRDAVRNGQRAFGENYLSEAVRKMDALADCGLEWHFTGPVQSNKTREIASRFDWVHGVDRDRVARRLGEQRPGSLAPLNVCVQINIDAEISKSGVAPGDAAALCEFVAVQPGLHGDEFAQRCGVPGRHAGFADLSIDIDLHTYIQWRQRSRPLLAEATRNPVAVHAVNPVEAGRDLARLVGLNRPGEMPFQPAIGERVHFPHGLGQIVLTEGALAVAHSITNRFNIEGLAHCEQPNGSRCAPGGGTRVLDPGPDLRKVFSDVRFLACHRVCR